jgi:rare lipoprotein A
MRFKFLIFLFVLVLVLSFCSGKRAPKTEPLPLEKRPGVQVEEGAPTDVVETGIASWYGGKFHGRRTANGEVYDKHKLTAAHQTLPFNTIVELENLENRKKVIVRINDRGPFLKGRIIDLSREAARRVGMEASGTAPVCLRILKPGDVTKNRAQNASGQPFHIQAGAYTVRENAQNVLRRIQAADIRISFAIHHQNGLYKVISETIPHRHKAASIQTKLKALGIDSYIKHPQ